MRSNIFTIFLILACSLTYGQDKKVWKGKPNSIANSLERLDQMFDDTAKYNFMIMPEDFAVSRLHHGFGRWMRNNWGLWGSGELKSELIDSGYVHPDDMSSALLKAYHRQLNNKPLDLKKDAAKYKAFWSKNGDGHSAGDVGIDFENLTTISDIIDYYPIGDTILVNIYAAYKKLLQTYASNVQGVAIVKSHNGNKLQVEILTLEQKKKHFPEREVGEIFETSPKYCNLIPPNNWKEKH